MRPLIDTRFLGNHELFDRLCWHTTNLLSGNIFHTELLLTAFLLDVDCWIAGHYRYPMTLQWQITLIKARLTCLELSISIVIETTLSLILVLNYNVDIEIHAFLWGIVVKRWLKSLWVILCRHVFLDLSIGLAGAPLIDLLFVLRDAEELFSILITAIKLNSLH